MNNMFRICHSIVSLRIIPFISGWMANRLEGDPEDWPRLAVALGKIIGLVHESPNAGYPYISI
jgi:adenosylcobinamide-phosphate synthase